MGPLHAFSYLVQIVGLSRGVLPERSKPRWALRAPDWLQAPHLAAINKSLLYTDRVAGLNFELITERLRQGSLTFGCKLDVGHHLTFSAEGKATFNLLLAENGSHVA
jgi:hypothetical protein